MIHPTRRQLRLAQTLLLGTFLLVFTLDVIISAAEGTVETTEGLGIVWLLAIIGYAIVRWLAWLNG